MKPFDQHQSEYDDLKEEKVSPPMSPPTPLTLKPLYCVLWDLELLIAIIACLISMLIVLGLILAVPRTSKFPPAGPRNINDLVIPDIEESRN